MVLRPTVRNQLKGFQLAGYEKKESIRAGSSASAQSVARPAYVLVISSLAAAG
jgi:hypothetical protein